MIVRGLAFFDEGKARGTKVNSVRGEVIQL